MVKKLTANGNGNGNGNGSGIRKWHVYLAIASMLIPMLGIIFSVGKVDASNEGRISRVEQDVKKVQEEYARKDLVDQKLLTMENTLARIEREEFNQGETLKSILVEQRRK